MHSAASHFHPVHEACFEAHLAKLSLRTFHPTLALRSNADLDPRSLGVCGLSFVGEGEEAFVTICPVMNAYSLFERTLVRASERLRRSRIILFFWTSAPDLELLPLCLSISYLVANQK